MPATTTKPKTTQQVLDEAIPDQIADAARRVALGTILQPLKITVTGLTATAAVNVTSAAVLAAAVINLGNNNYNASKLLPAIGAIRNLRVTASGTPASLGTYIPTDAAGTMVIPPGGANVAVGVCQLSDDGKTITFPNTITGFVLEYIPRPPADLTTVFAPST